MGETTEVVSKQMYTFDDRGGRSLSLRPEGTAGVVRAYIQAGSPGTMKLSYSGPMFRYEQPQAGPPAPVLADRGGVSRRLVARGQTPK